MPTQPSIAITVDEAIHFIKTIAPEYKQKAQDLTERGRLEYALLSKHGRLKFNQGGSHTCTWTIQIAEPPMQAHGAYTEFTFDEHDLWKQLTVDWRGYNMTDKLVRKHYIVGYSHPGLAIVNRYRDILGNLVSAFKNRMHGELYVDGMAASNDNRFHGLETFMNHVTPVASDMIAQPDDNYGGLDTDLASQGGTWSSDLPTADRPNASLAKDYPHGTGGTEYDSTSPLLMNTSSTRWTGSPDWEDNCERCMHQAIDWMSKNRGADGVPTCLLWASNMMTPIKYYFSSRFRTITPHKEAEELGFGGSIDFDGVILKTAYDVPAGVGYGLNVQKMEVAFCTDDMYETRGPVEDPKTGSYLFELFTFGNCRYSPPYFIKFKAYA